MFLCKIIQPLQMSLSTVQTLEEELKPVIPGDQHRFKKRVLRGPAVPVLAFILNHHVKI